MSDSVAAKLEAEARTFGGRVGYAVSNGASGDLLTWQADEKFPTASAIKLPVLSAFHAFVDGGGVRWEDNVKITREWIPGGSGVLEHLSMPREVSYLDAAWLMICLSDNLATNILLEAMTIELANDLIEQIAGDGITVKGYAGFRPDGPVKSMGEATPRALHRYLQRLRAGTVPGAAATIEVAFQQFYRHSIPRYLPIDRYRESTLRIAHKSGSLPGIRTDIGLLESGEAMAELVFMTADAEDTGSSFENAGERCIGRLARIVYDALQRGEW